MPVIIAMAANNLAGVYLAQQRWAEALPLFQRAYEIRKQALGADDQLTKTTAERLSGCHALLGHWGDVEGLQRELLGFYTKTAGASSSAVLETMRTIAVACRHQGNYAEAARLYQEEEGLLRSKNELESAVAGSLYNDWAYLFIASGSPATALPLYDKAISIREHDSNPMDLAASLDNRADAQSVMGDVVGAAATSQRSFDIMERLVGDKGAEGQVALVLVLQQHAGRLEAAGRGSDAETLRQRAEQIRQQNPDLVAKFDDLEAQMKAADGER